MNGIRLPNREQVSHCFTLLATHGKRVMDFIPTRCKIERYIGLDAVKYPGFGKKLPAGLTHKMDGSKATFWYKAAHKPTQDQIDKAAFAVNVLKIPRRRYTGTLVDVFTNKGTLYALLAGVLERDREQSKSQINYRMFNLDDGDLYAAYIEQVAAPVKVSAVKKAVKALAKVKAKRAPKPKPAKKVKP
jgi:hypothetical protein